MPQTGSVLRPIGFRPWEISALINQQVIDQHAEEAAFLWTHRDHATSAPQYALKDLAKLDERTEAHVDGLRVAAEAGWKTALAQLDQGPGEVFAASVLAFESADVERIDAVFKIGCSAPKLARALIAALGWMSQDAAVREATKLLASANPEIARTGIAGMAVHRVDPGEALTQSISSLNPRLASRAMRAAAELGRVDLLSQISVRLRDPDPGCRFWAAWSMVRLGDRYHAIEVLKETVEARVAEAPRALDLAVRVTRLEDAHVWREYLSRDPQTLRLATIAAGSIGDPAAIPSLIRLMENPKLARIAGGSFSMITGADLGYEDLEGDAPEATDDDFGDDDGETDYRWPNPGAVAVWWAKREASYTTGVRYLLGEPIGESSLLNALAKGRQNQRAAAALELALLHPSQILFETRERAQRQRLKVAQWSS